MREQGGLETERFTVARRQERGILMVAVGDTVETSEGSYRPMKSLPDSAKSTSWVRSYQGDHAGQRGCQEFHARPTGAGRTEFLVGNRLDPAATWSDRGGLGLGGGLQRSIGRRWGVRERFRGCGSVGGRS